ncbi:MAG: hypothetical protein V2I27_02620 [Erythrobacter sp.]|nr:hypothetical protein [Erythrobacter sp.]
MSSNATRSATSACIAALAGFGLCSTGAPVAAQDDAGVTQQAATQDTAGPDEDESPRNRAIDILVTVPRGEINQAQAQECADRADAGAISGEILVCRRIGEDPSNYYSGGRAAAQKRYAQETAFQGDPQAPNTFGIPNHGNPIGFGAPPPPALIIDVEALPQAPPGSDADRIARGLPPLGESEELTEEQIRKRREALGLPPPKFERAPK